MATEIFSQSEDYLQKIIKSVIHNYHLMHFSHELWATRSVTTSERVVYNKIFLHSNVFNMHYILCAKCDIVNSRYNFIYFLFFTVTGSTKQNTVAATNQIQSNQVFLHGSCNQPYRYGGRVGLFGHYLRSLRIILLLTCIKLDAVLPKRRKRCSKEHLLKSICELATNLEGVERRYVKKGQRLLFCGPDLMALVPKCTEIRAAFDALHGE